MSQHRLTAYFAEERRSQQSRARHFAMVPTFALAAIGAAAALYAYAYAQAERQVRVRRERAAELRMQDERRRLQSYRWN
ncbi:MAG: hypothetical protein QM811_04975 [Pirellulales bacterium]